MLNERLQIRKPARSAKKENRTVFIRKSNDLVEGRYKFDIWETRIFLKMLTLIRQDDTGFHEYKMYIKDIIDTFGVDSKDAYRLIKEGAVKLMGKTIETKIRVEAGWEDFVAPIVAGFKGRSEADEPSYIKLSFHPDMRPLLLELRERFLVYDFQNVRNLSSPYYVRIYELLKQYEKIGERRFEVVELREILGLSDEYKLYGHFKNRILEPSRARLAEHTDIIFTYEEKKKGRAVDSLLFRIRSNRPMKTTRNVRKNRLTLPANEPMLLDLSTTENRSAAIENGATANENSLFDAFFSRLNDWWGIQAAEFEKRLTGKTGNDVERAIEFTKERIRAGKAENPAGVFLDALARGLQTPHQQKAAQQAERTRRTEETRQQLAAWVEQHRLLTDEYVAIENELVRAITTVHPEATAEVIEEIKRGYRAMGDLRIEPLSVDDFRKNPTLRNLVIEGIIQHFPARFEEIRGRFLPKIEVVRQEIRRIKPDFVFG